MRNLKKTLSMLLCALMLLSGLGVTAQSKPVEIEWWIGLGGNIGDVYLSVVDDYNASQDKVHVTVVQYADYVTLINAYQAALVAGVNPAVVQMPTEYLAAFEPYLEVLNERYTDESFHAETLAPGCLAWMYASDNESLMGVPLFATTQVMYYRKDAFEGYDIDQVFSTYQTLAEAAAEITKKDENGNTIFYGWEPMHDWCNICDAVYSAGGCIFTDDSLRTVNFLSDEWIEVISSYRKWIHEDGIMRTHFGGTGWEYWYETIDDVMEGRAAGYVGSVSDQGDLDFSIIGAHAQPGWGDNTSPRSLTTAHLLSMSANKSDAEKDAAWDFMKYMTSDYAQGKVFMGCGYCPTRTTTANDPTFAAYCEENPHALGILDAIAGAYAWPLDPTGTNMTTGIIDMMDRVFIENMDPVEALTILQEEYQAILDEYWADQE